MGISDFRVGIRRNLPTVVILLTAYVLSGMPVQAQIPGDNEAFVTTGSGQWLEVADTPELASPVFTVECWVRVESSGLLITRDIGSGTPSDWQLWYEDRRVAFITARTPPDSYFFTPTGSIVPGKWHHLALTVNGPDGFAELYIDGVSVIQPTFSSRYFDAQTGLALGGYYGNAGGSYLRGAMDEVRFWNHIRSEDEIHRNMHRRLPHSERSGLVGYWSFCGNFADSSGYGHHLDPFGVLRPEVVSGLPPALSCDAALEETPSITWSGPFFPANPCLRDSLSLSAITITNGTEEPQLLERLFLTGEHAADFAVINDPTPVQLMPGDSLRIACGFHPGDHGIRNATLILVLPDTSLSISMEAEYRGPLLNIDGLPVHMRSLDGSAATATVTVLNLSTQRDATITDVTFTPPTSLSLDTPLPLSIPPASSRSLIVRFDPAAEGTVEAGITLVIDGCATVSTIRADACPSTQFGTLDIPFTQGTPGDTVMVPLRVKQWDAYIRVESAILYGQLEIDCHALYPLFGDGGSWENGTRTVAMEIALGSDSDTVAVLPFLVLLGTDTSCTLTWTVDSVRSDCPLTLAGSNSIAAVIDLCQENGTRLFDASRALFLEAPHPSPGNGVVQLRFHTVEQGMTEVYLVDVQGRRLRTLVHGTLPPGSHQRSFNTKELPSGVYLLLLSTPHQLRSRRFIVVK